MDLYPPHFRFQWWLCSRITFHFRTASLPGVGGMQISPQKCIQMHETMHLHAINHKKAKYSTKSATRTFLRVRLEFLHGLCGSDVSRFSPRMDTQLCMDVEEYYWSAPMKFVLLKHASVARKMSSFHANEPGSRNISGPNSRSARQTRLPSPLDASDIHRNTQSCVAAQVWSHLAESEVPEPEGGKYLKIVTMLWSPFKGRRKTPAYTADVRPSVFVLLIDLTTHDDLSPTLA